MNPALFITGCNSFQSSIPSPRTSTMAEKKERATQKMHLYMAISKVVLDMDDGNVDSASTSSANLQGLYADFCAAHDAYVLTLTDGDSIESSVTYCDEVFDRYRSTMRQLRIMASVELAPEPQRLLNDSAMTSSFVQALDLPPIEIDTPAVETSDLERVTEPQHPRDDSAMTSSFVQAHELPRIEITTPAVIIAHDVLVGQLENSAAVKLLDVSSAHEDKPVALLTVLGSTLKGPVPPQPSCARVTSHLISSSVTKKKQIADPSHHNKLSRVEGDIQRFDATSSDVGILISRGLSRLQFVLLLFLCCSVSAFASSQCAAHSRTSFKFQGGGVLFPRNNCVFFPYLHLFFNLLLFELFPYLYPSKSNALYYTLFTLP